MRKKINTTQNASILNQITSLKQSQIIIFNIYKRHSLQTYREGNLGTRTKISNSPHNCVRQHRQKNLFRFILSVKKHLLYSERCVRVMT